ncbi:MAG: ABC transporter substrate binding protein, partial [Vicinamibacteria bacterium]
GIKRIGLLYTPELFGDYVATLKSLSRRSGIEIVDEAVTSPREFTTQFGKVVRKKIDLFLILPDFRIYDEQATRYTLLNSFKAGIPCTGPSAAFVKSGALWGLDVSLSGVGAQAAELLDQILGGEQVPPWRDARATELSLNTGTAEKLAIDVSRAVLQAAVRVTP